MRFPGFGGEWKTLFVNDVCPEFQSGKNIKAENIKSEGLYPVYGGNGLRGYTDIYNHDGTYVLIGRQGALCGNVRLVEGRNYITEHAIAVSSSNEHCIYFLYYLFYKMNLGQYSDQSAQPGLAVNKLLRLKLHIPLKDEQTKIAKILTLLDTRIATQNKIIEQLQSLIKGIVVLITAETPNARIEKCLVCHSSTLQENNIEDFGDFPVYGANGICGYTVNADFNEPAILIVKDGSGVGNVRFVNGRYSVIGTQNIFTPQNEICLKYIFYCLQAFNFVPYKTGMAIPHIYFKDYGKAKIYCPNFEQQVKIASQIDLIESKIEIATQLLNKYEEQKKFLLSNMFI